MDNRIIFSNMIWRLAERVGAQLVTFVVSVILARMLDPNTYGTVALVTVFITILQVFVDSGLGNALIQKKDADDIDFSTVFYTNILFCAVMYILLFCSAPYIAIFFGEKKIQQYIRVLGLTIVISGVKNVQQAYVSRNMMFRCFFFSTLGGTIIAGIIGIIMAYKGFGVWSLIIQQVLNLAIDTIILCITVQWTPKLVFSLKRLKKLFSFGWKLLVSSLLDTIYNNIRQLLVGKIYSSSDLAQYNRGKQFPDLIIRNINTTIDSVLLAAMSNQQEDIKKVKNMTRKSIKMSVYIVAPIMMGLAFCGENIIKLILTEKWLPCVFFMQIFCVSYIFYPIHTANLNALKAIGRSDLFLKLEVEKKVIGMVALLATVFISVKAMAYSLLITSVLNQIINSSPNHKLLNYGYTDQLKDVVPAITLSIFMGLIIYPVNFVDVPYYIALLIQIPLGVLIYIIGSILFHIDSFYDLFGIIKSYFRKNS